MRCFSCLWGGERCRFGILCLLIWIFCWFIRRSNKTDLRIGLLFRNWGVKESHRLLRLVWNYCDHFLDKAELYPLIFACLNTALYHQVWSSWLFIFESAQFVMNDFKLIRCVLVIPMFILFIAFWKSALMIIFAVVVVTLSLKISILPFYLCLLILAFITIWLISLFSSFIFYLTWHPSLPLISLVFI